MNSSPGTSHHARRIWNICTLLASTLIFTFANQVVLANGTASTPSNAPIPGDYYDDGNKTPASKACLNQFRYGAALPRSKTLPNRYVLLLAFDTAQADGQSLNDSDYAGAKLFLADPQDSKSVTVGCVADPDYPPAAPGTRSSDPHDGWSLRAKGGCPSDCTANAVRNIDAKSDPCVPPADPLNSMTDVHWGIFFAFTDSAKCRSPSDQMRVWQIQTKDAIHAHKLLLALLGEIKKQKLAGYLGAMVIGHTTTQCEAGYAWQATGSSTGADEQQWQCVRVTGGPAKTMP